MLLVLLAGCKNDFHLTDSPDPSLIDSAAADDTAESTGDTGGESTDDTAGECVERPIGPAGSVAIVAACPSTPEPVPVAAPWSTSDAWTYEAPTGEPARTSLFTTPIVGNLDDDDGDGRVDDADDPDVLVVMVEMDDQTWADGTLVALEGATGEEKWSADVDFFAGIALADVDGDDRPDVVTYDTDNHLVAFEGDGTPKWTSPDARIFHDEMETPLVADLDGDGLAEIIAGESVVSGADGSLRFELDGRGIYFGAAAVADADLDGRQEVYLAGVAYDADGNELWRVDTGARATSVWPAIVQADADPEAEIAWLGSRFSLWEPDGTRIFDQPFDDSFVQVGPPCAGDLDGDGAQELAWPSWYDFHAYELDGTSMWDVAIDDGSGLAGCSVFDVDGDGAMEVLFRDQSALWFFDGATGTARVNQTGEYSVTGYEYPVVADVDRDGHAEILVAGSEYSYMPHTALTVLRHAGAGWNAVAHAWNAHDYSGSNFASDGGVPAVPPRYWTDPGVYRGPGAPPGPDLTVVITDLCAVDCAAGPVRVGVKVSNIGGATVAAGTPLRLLRLDDGQEIGRVTLPEIGPGEAVAGTVDVAPDALDAGVAAEIGPVEDDCDADNDRDEWNDPVCP